MSSITKGRSPFYPGQPVPADLFVGRMTEINRIIRALDQVTFGKPQAIFLTGEYGIGKSSLAGFMKHYAEKEKHILGIHVLLGGAETLEDMATKTVEAAIKTEAYEPTITEKVRGALSKYVGRQEFFGININLEALKADAPNLSAGYLPFLRQLLERVKENGINGLMLILDEINGITKSPKFSHFIKGLVDENALSAKPLPLFLMLCGVEERRLEMIQHHKPIERIFDLVEISPMNDVEMKDFFNKTFGSVGMRVEDDAMKELCHFSAGFPKIMHIIGDAVFWADRDSVINEHDAVSGVLSAADEVGTKFVDKQVYKALRSKDYRSILEKLAKEGAIKYSFKKSDIEKELSPAERGKLNNFLQKMKKLNVLRSGDEQGEYVFTSRLVRLYILYKSLEKKDSAA